MTSRLATSLAVLAVAAGAAAEPPKLGGEKPDPGTISAVARVAGASKAVDGVTHHLVAWRFDRMQYMRQTNGSDLCWSLAAGDGTPLPQAVVDAGPVGRWEDGVMTAWVRLPEKGTVEAMLGVISYSPANHDKKAVRQKLLKARYKPFTLDVKDIPVVEAKTAEELSKAVLALPEPKAADPDRDKK